MKVLEDSHSGQHTNPVFGKSLVIYVLLLISTAGFNHSDGCELIFGNGKSEKHIMLGDIAAGNIDNPPTRVVHVIAEQDPDGIYWGLRDTITGKLLLAYTYQKIGDFKDGFAIVFHNGKFGLIDKSGKVIIEPAYDFPKTGIKCGVIVFEVGYGPVVIFDTTGNSVMPLVYGMTGILPCQKRITYGHYSYGLLNFNGDTILPFLFNNARLFPEGFFVASKQDHISHTSLYGLYDLEGRQVLPHVFESIDGFYYGRSIVKKNSKYGVIDESGHELFYTGYGRIDRFYNDYALVYSNPENGEVRVGIIDKNGREVVPVIYQWLDHVYNFSEGLAAMAQNFKFGFVDTTAKVVIQFKYEKVESFKNGLAKVWVDWRHVGYINRKGEEVITADFDAMGQHNLRRYHSGFIIGLKDSVQHVFDYSGNEVATLNYATISEFNDNDKYYIVSKNNKWGILDSNFQVKIPVEYESLETIFPGSIAARRNGKIGIINYQGQAFSPFKYDWIEPYQDYYMHEYENGLALVGINGMTGLINGYGKLIIPAKYDKIEDFSYGLAVVKRNGKYGYVNDKGIEVIPAIYDGANQYDGYSAEVSLEGETFQIDNSGNRIEVEDY